MKGIDILQARREARLSQSEVADALGIWRGSLVEIERERIDLAPSFAMHIIATIQRLSNREQKAQVA